MWIRHCAVALLVLSGCTGGAGPDQQAGQGPMAGGPDTGTEPVEKLLPPPPVPRSCTRMRRWRRHSRTSVSGKRIRCM